MTASPSFVVIGDVAGRRVAMFQRALERVGVPQARVISYPDVMDGHLGELGSETILRLESPGGDFEAERRFIARGYDEEDDLDTARFPPERVRWLEQEPGRIHAPRQWYLGYRALLRELEASYPDVEVMNHPADVAVMFDKRQTHARCVAAGVPVPPDVGPVASYDELRARMRDAGVRQVFIKMINGSSASGVIAYRAGRGDREVAVTSAALVRGEGGEPQLFNSLRIRRYTRRDTIAEVVNTLCRLGGVHVEVWIPKASQGGRPFDLRVVVIGGHARHVVVRQGTSPMTNLHLGNARGDMEELRGRVSPEAWGEMMRTCEQAMGVFPRSLYAGVDLLVQRNLEASAVLEVNAYGDLLPRVLFEGMDTYEAEIRAAVASWEETS
ncbi:MAG: hypothetical protein CMH57_10540 [Myxococcales bacterium]|nr:hypothetical protein [Myxococcales bacterium]